MPKVITLTGVESIRPHNNENSFIVTFWNSGTVVVHTKNDVGVSKDNEVLLWGER
jgi:hypothetical protein